MKPVIGCYSARPGLSTNLMGKGQKVENDATGQLNHLWIR
jgi:hypothetical protein